MEPEAGGEFSPFDPRRGVGSVYALVFGLFLGLALLKFGNPVILDESVAPPDSLRELVAFAWPIHWAYWLLVPLAVAGAAIAALCRPRWRGSPWLWILPVIWFGWQIVSAARTVDHQLSREALWNFVGCLAAYFGAALLYGQRAALRWLLIGLLAGFAWCLVRAANQKLVEFPAERQSLEQGPAAGWTNVPPDLLLEMKRDRILIATNGVYVANPVILAKYSKGRVMGTLVYPNALAGAILLLGPVSILLAFGGTRRFRPLTRLVAIGLSLFLSVGGLVWSGSKFGWLIALGLGGLALLRLDWPRAGKLALVATVMVAGLGVFIWRFHGYFAAGATSAGARLDYWKAAMEVVADYPLTGTGPGTFQRPFARLKAPESEMARLAHNDYLEQFSDSGVIGGLSYLAWIVGSLGVAGRKFWRSRDPVVVAIFLGLLGWFFQGLGEFGLYIPALAWTAFSLLGWLVAVAGNRIDKVAATH
jgi:hypothetical protein